MTKMRLLVVSSDHHPSQGGIGAAVWAFVHHATSAGWQIGLLTRESAHAPPRATIHAIRTKDCEGAFARMVGPLRRIDRIRPYRYGLWSLAVAKRLLEMDVDYDAIEFVDSRAEGYVSLTSHAVRDRWPGVPMYIRAHAPMFLIENISGFDDSRFGRHIYHEWERNALSAADGIIVPSHMLQCALPNQPCTAVIPPPLAFELPSCPRRNENTILFVGGVEPNKGVDLWAQSLNRVLPQFPNMKAVLVGPDTPTAPGGKSMSSHVIAIINTSLQRQFHWTGPLPHDEVQHMIRTAAMIVVPSRFESFSFVAAEAIQAEIPLIISDGVGIREYVPAAVVVKSGEVEALAAAQMRVLADARVARADVVRNQLAIACAPLDVLERNAKFIRQLTAVKRNNAGMNRFESIHEVTRCLESIELSIAEAIAESPSAACSSAMS